MAPSVSKVGVGDGKKVDKGMSAVAPQAATHTSLNIDFANKLEELEAEVAALKAENSILKKNAKFDRQAAGSTRIDNQNGLTLNAVGLSASLTLKSTARKLEATKTDLVNVQKKLKEKDATIVAAKKKLDDLAQERDNALDVAEKRQAHIAAVEESLAQSYTDVLKIQNDAAKEYDVVVQERDDTVKKLDAMRKDNERLILNAEHAAQDRDAAVKERDTLVEKLDTAERALQTQDSIVKDRDALGKKLEAVERALQEQINVAELLRKERDAHVAKLEASQRSAKDPDDTFEDVRKEQDVLPEKTSSDRTVQDHDAIVKERDAPVEKLAATEQIIDDQNTVIKESEPLRGMLEAAVQGQNDAVEARDAATKERDSIEKKLKAYTKISEGVIQSLKAEVASITAERDNAQERIALTLKQLDSAFREREKAIEHRNAVIRDRDAINQQCVTLNTMFASQNISLDRVTKQLAGIQKMADVANQERLAAIDIAASKQKRIVELTAELNAAKEETALQTAALSADREENSVQAATVVHLEDKKVALAKGVERLTRTKTNLKGKVEKLEHHLDNKMKEGRKLQAKVGQLEKEIIKKTQDNTSLQAKLDEWEHYTNQLTLTSGQSTHLKTRPTEAHQEAQFASVVRAKREAKHTTLKKSGDMVNHEISLLRAQINTLKKQNEMEHADRLDSLDIAKSYISVANETRRKCASLEEEVKIAQQQRDQAYCMYSELTHVLEKQMQSNVSAIVGDQKRYFEVYHKAYTLERGLEVERKAHNDAVANFNARVADLMSTKSPTEVEFIKLREKIKEQDDLIAILRYDTRATECVIEAWNQLYGEKKGDEKKAGEEQAAEKKGGEEQGNEKNTPSTGKPRKVDLVPEKPSVDACPCYFHVKLALEWMRAHAETLMEHTAELNDKQLRAEAGVADLRLRIAQSESQPTSANNASGSVIHTSGPASTMSGHVGKMYRSVADLSSSIGDVNDALVEASKSAPKSGSSAIHSRTVAGIRDALSELSVFVAGMSGSISEMSAFVKELSGPSPQRSGSVTDTPRSVSGISGAVSETSEVQDTTTEQGGVDEAEGSNNEDDDISDAESEASIEFIINVKPNPPAEPQPESQPEE